MLKLTDDGVPAAAKGGADLRSRLLIKQLRADLGSLWNLDDPSIARGLADFLAAHARLEHWAGLAARARVAIPDADAQVQLLAELRKGRT